MLARLYFYLLIITLYSKTIFSADSRQPMQLAYDREKGTLTYKQGTPAQFDIFCESLLAYNPVVKLTISQVYFLDKKIVAFATNLSRQHGTSLKSLMVCNNGLTHTSIITLLSYLPQLEELDVSNNILSLSFDSATQMLKNEPNETLQPLAPAIAHLKKLYMNECSLTGDQVGWIAEFLKTNTKLEVLSLIKNNIGVNDGTISMLNLIHAADTEGNPLKVLDLSFNHAQKPPSYTAKRKDLKVIV